MIPVKTKYICRNNFFTMNIFFCVVVGSFHIYVHICVIHEFGLAPVDILKLFSDLPPLKKNFYTEAVSVSMLTPDEVDAWR